MDMEDTQTFDFSNTFECQVRHIPTKRFFDITFSLLAMFLALPLFIVIGLAVFATSRGKIIYAHRRIGRGGKNFHCFKFRTMYRDADDRLKQLLSSDPELNEEWQKSHKLKNDPRVTPIGRFLRKCSLDELPQFWNVLKGDLSIVGPRPVVEEELQLHIGPKAGKILSIRPGITGLWQVSGRSDTTYDTRIRLDEHYIDNHSLYLDFKLILKTIPAIISSRGAY